jgi:hypothetical protein
VFSYLGFKSQEIRVNNNHIINVVMEEDSTVLAEKNISDTEQNDPAPNILNPIKAVMEIKES